jgi:hypothetical protein
MTNPNIYTGTVGAELQIATSMDLVTDVASVTIAVRAPDYAETTWTPDSATIDGLITYTTQEGDLVKSGVYRLQPVVTMTDGDVWPLTPVEWVIRSRFEVV